MNSKKENTSTLLNILFIESDDIHYDQVIKISESENDYRFHISQSLDDLSKWLDEKSFHVIVADFFQKNFYLEELFEQMLSRNIKCPIIIYSAASKNFLTPYVRDYLMAKETGAISFVSKFAPLQLLEVLASLKKEQDSKLKNKSEDL